uniref:ATP synthase subunit a n=1 Tax=Hoplopleura kitti TaxID=1511644 RepID=A0A075EB36_9NEOP|nr:ATP synthase subunit 6 [Hoplopleura kitti]
MMSSLMSVFDPSSSLFYVILPLKELTQLSLLVVLSSWLWPIMSGMGCLVNLCFKWAKGASFGFLLCWLFQFILLTNLMGMLPMAYTFSSSLQFSLGLSVSLWLGGVLYALTVSVERVLAHLCPEGVEGVMSLFLVVIELTSLFIRPMSLGIRLMANLTAGHMIMALCESGFSLQHSSIASVFSLISLCLISLFETAVAVVQAYIFVSLIYLYWEES